MIEEQDLQNLRDQILKKNLSVKLLFNAVGFLHDNNYFPEKKILYGNQMMNIKTPIIVTIIGEGASGGALGIGVGDLVFMLENTWYSVISPESCSSILWRSWEYKEIAADALKLTANDMLESNLIDKIIGEPLGGAHFDRELTFNSVKKELVSSFRRLDKLDNEKLIQLRREKFFKMGTFHG